MTDVQRMGLAVVFFVAGAVLTLAVSAVAGMVFMVLGLAALLWGRTIGDNRRSRDDRS